MQVPQGKSNNEHSQLDYVFDSPCLPEAEASFGISEFGVVEATE